MNADQRESAGTQVQWPSDSARNSVLGWLESMAMSPSRYVRFIAGRAQACPPHVLRRLAGDPSFSVRTAVGFNPSTPMDVLAKLARGTEPHILPRLALNPSIPGNVLDALATHADPDVRAGVAANRNAPETALLRLAHDPSSAVRSSVAENPSATWAVLASLPRRPEGEGLDAAPQRQRRAEAMSVTGATELQHDCVSHHGPGCVLSASTLVQLLELPLSDFTEWLRGYPDLWSERWLWADAVLARPDLPVEFVCAAISNGWAAERVLSVAGIPASSLGRSALLHDASAPGALKVRIAGYLPREIARALVAHPDPHVRLGIALNRGAGAAFAELLDDADHMVRDAAQSRVVQALGA